MIFLVDLVCYMLCICSHSLSKHLVYKSSLTIDDQFKFVYVVDTNFSILIKTINQYIANNLE